MTHLTHWSAPDAPNWDEAIDRTRFWAQRPSFVDNRLSGRHIVQLYLNPSLRTRCSMDVAASRLGMSSTVLVPGANSWTLEFDPGAIMDAAAAEHVTEAAGVLSGYFDAIGFRAFAGMKDYARDRDDLVLRSFARHVSVPLINLESAFYHPCQALADAAILRDRLGSPSGQKFVLAWAYHPRPLPMAVPNSTLLMAARLGMDVVVARPEGFGLDDGIMRDAHTAAAIAGGSVSVGANLAEAASGARVVYAKSWAGRSVYTDRESENRARTAAKSWRITSAVMERTDAGRFMHCLPVRRNVVVDDDVLDSEAAIHLDQAAYRRFANQSILETLLEKQ